jgi:glycosyltransferase involved in cell wall biosynthesis
MESDDKVEPDTSVLADRILYLLQNPDMAKELGNNARKRYLENYSADVFRENMLKIYKVILNENTWI